MPHIWASHRAVRSSIHSSVAGTGCSAMKSPAIHSSIEKRTALAR